MTTAAMVGCNGLAIDCCFADKLVLVMAKGEVGGENVEAKLARLRSV